MPAGVGIVGAGNISTQYLTNLTRFPDVEVVAIGDLDEGRAREQAQAFGVGSAGDVRSVLDHPGVDIVINLTIPAAHVAVSTEAIRAGKHVWSEKPLGLDRASARALLDEAAAAGLQVCCAPDTVLGPGIQTTLRAIGDGSIGRAFAGLAIMQNPGPDAWHPNPDFFFAAGGGPVLDIGPYYLTSLVLGLGPVTSVYAGGGRAREVRTVMAGPRTGETFPVTVPTTANAVLTHASGASSVCLFSFDSGQRRAGVLEFQGTVATLVAPDPNRFDGTLQTYVGGEVQGEQELDDRGMGRGIGVVDLARSLADGTTPRANGELAYHVLDVMLAIEESVGSGNLVAVTSVPPIVEPLAADWTPLASR
jgi:predicted dehydrogenase